MLRDSELLVLESCKVCRVLDSLVEVSMKACDTNDTRALKCHYLATIIRLAKKSLAEPNGSLDRFVRRCVFSVVPSPIGGGFSSSYPSLSH